MNTKKVLDIGSVLLPPPRLPLGSFILVVLSALTMRATKCRLRCDANGLVVEMRDADGRWTPCQLDEVKYSLTDLLEVISPYEQRDQLSECFDAQSYVLVQVEESQVPFLVRLEADVLCLEIMSDLESSHAAERLLKTIEDLAGRSELEH